MGWEGVHDLPTWPSSTSKLVSRLELGLVGFDSFISCSFRVYDCVFV